MAIPFDLISRIIIPSDIIRALNGDQVAFTASTGKRMSPLCSANGVDIYLPNSELLKAEQGFMTSLNKRLKKDTRVIARLNAALAALEKFEEDYPELIPKRDNYVSPDAAEGHHGCLHSVRVMFWGAFLAQHLDDPTRDRFLPAVLAAAALHDTCRRQDHEDHEHGALAAVRHGEKIAAYMPDTIIHASCLNAIRLHCCPDAQCNSGDIVWQILKDADALDRGRFGPPNSEAGCKISFFRTDFLKRGDSYHNVSWMAYWAARMSSYAPIDGTPCRNFCSWFCDAIRAFQLIHAGSSAPPSNG